MNDANRAKLIADIMHNMNNQGKIIVFEGLDGSGKTVQFNLLLQKLQEMGRRVATVDFPDYNSFYGQLVARYLNQDFGDVYEVSPYLSALLYAGDRKGSSAKLWKWLEEGYIVLANRYAGANQAYQAGKLPEEERPALIDWLKELEYNQLPPIPRENLVIYLHSEVSMAQRMVDRKAARSYTDKQRDIHERNAGYLAEVEATYLYLCRTEPHWTRLEVIDPSTGQMYPPEVILERVLAELRQREIL